MKKTLSRLNKVISKLESRNLTKEADILHRIFVKLADDEKVCKVCGKPIPSDSPYDDYCCEACKEKDEENEG